MTLVEIGVMSVTTEVDSIGSKTEDSDGLIGSTVEDSVGWIELELELGSTLEVELGSTVDVELVPISTPGTLIGVLGLCTTELTELDPDGSTEGNSVGIAVGNALGILLGNKPGPKLLRLESELDWVVLEIIDVPLDKLETVLVCSKVFELLNELIELKLDPVLTADVITLLGLITIGGIAGN